METLIISSDVYYLEEMFEKLREIYNRDDQGVSISFNRNRISIITAEIEDQIMIGSEITMMLLEEEIDEFKIQRGYHTED